MLKFFADENVHSEIISSLREKSLDIMTVFDAALAGRKDYEILEYCQKRGFILLTGDKDFGGLLEFGCLFGKGKVVLFRYTLMNIQKIVSEFMEMLKNEEKKLLDCKSVLVVLTEGRYRIHCPK